jgi:nucleotide-binding universal stress UspA family protein
MLDISTILFPTDFSEHALPAFHVASALAHDHRADLIVMHVRELPSVAFTELGAIPPPALPSRPEVIEKLHQYEPPDAAVHVDYMVVDGVAAEEIVRTSTDHNCDMIVMGTHGRTGLSRLIMGSVAEEVVRKAPCPVLTLKSPMPAAERLEAEPAIA